MVLVDIEQHLIQHLLDHDAWHGVGQGDVNELPAHIIGLLDITVEYAKAVESPEVGHHTTKLRLSWVEMGGALYDPVLQNGADGDGVAVSRSRQIRQMPLPRLIKAALLFVGQKHVIVAAHNEVLMPGVTQTAVCAAFVVGKVCGLIPMPCARMCAHFFVVRIPGRWGSELSKPMISTMWLHYAYRFITGARLQILHALLGG